MFICNRLHLPHCFPVCVLHVTLPHALIKRSLFLLFPSLFNCLFLTFYLSFLPQHTSLPFKRYVRHDGAVALTLYAHAKGCKLLLAGYGARAGILAAYWMRRIIWK